jgi:hypothetical protein
MTFLLSSAYDSSLGLLLLYFPLHDQQKKKLQQMRSSFRNSKPNSVILVATDSRGCKLFEGRRRNWWQLLWPEDDRSFCKITQQTKNLKNSGAVVRLCLSLCLPLLHTHSNGRRPTRGRVKAKKMKE